MKGGKRLMDFMMTIINAIKDIVKLIQNLVKQLRGDPTQWGEDDFVVLK